MNVFDEVIKFNTQRDLLKEYNESKEVSFITEELTELLRTNDVEQKVDGFCDLIVFAIGAIAKLGYLPEQAMQEVCKHINSESGGYFDDEAKKWIKGKRTYHPDFSKARFKKC